MTTSNQLLPCPFCGGDAQMAESDTVYWVKCTQCESEGATNAYSAKAIAAWNRRATQPAAGEPVAWMRSSGNDVMTAKQKADCQQHNGLPGKRIAEHFSVPLYTAPPAAAPVAAGEPVAFANELISGALQGGDFSGADIQELAVKHGLLREERREEPCRDEGCACAEYGFPTECYRKTAALAPPAAAPVSDGEPVAWMIDWPDEPELGHYFSESPDELTGSRSRPLFTAAPPAAAHGDEAVACLHRLIDARNKHIASGYFCVDCGAAFAAADHAAIRNQGEGGAA